MRWTPGLDENGGFINTTVGLQVRQIIGDGLRVVTGDQRVLEPGAQSNPARTAAISFRVQGIP